MQKFLIPIFIFLTIFVNGCTALPKSSYHAGAMYEKNQRILGAVSKETAQKSEDFLEKFHQAVQGGQYAAAHDLFSSELKEKLPLEKFTAELRKLAVNYGPEEFWGILWQPVTLEFARTDEAAFADGFMFYDAVISKYTSERLALPIHFSFGLTVEAGEIKICLFGYSVPEENLFVEYDAVPRRSHP